MLKRFECSRDDVRRQRVSTQTGALAMKRFFFTAMATLVLAFVLATGILYALRTMAPSISERYELRRHGPERSWQLRREPPFSR